MLCMDGIGTCYMTCCHEFVLVHVLADLPTRKEPLSISENNTSRDLTLEKTQHDYVTLNTSLSSENYPYK